MKEPCALVSYRGKEGGTLEERRRDGKTNESSDHKVRRRQKDEKKFEKESPSLVACLDVGTASSVTSSTLEVQLVQSDFLSPL